MFLCSTCAEKAASMQLQLFLQWFKGILSRDFQLMFFSCISFPQAPENNIMAVSNFVEISRRYSHLKMYQRCH
jgi:hypothetical protein